MGELNKFAILSEEEFAARYLAPARDVSDPAVKLNYPCAGVYFQDDGSTAPAALSYVAGETTSDQVRVTMVKDQGSCGSCWSFGASAAIEQLMCQKGLKDCNTWTGLATQQMVDCASYTHTSTDPNVIDLFPYDNHGCNGGLEPNAMRYVQLNGGQMNWDDYPYVSGSTKTEGTCAYDQTKANLNLSSGCVRLPSADENTMVDAIANKGPLGIGINASGRGFSLYTSGVYSNPSCTDRLNHAVLATGYGTWAATGQDYFEIKNSWGASWCDSGFINVARNDGNMCGVSSDAMYNLA